jgi:Mn2+/Fe2+ NRAMP family transporter
VKPSRPSPAAAHRGRLLGAVFLMATSAVGPGFLTQTTVFTERLLASFGFVILVSIILDIGAQLNIWQIIAGHRARAQEIAQQIIPGSGYLLTAAILFGGLAFNVGNLSGTGLGLNALTGMPVIWGAVISAAVVTVLFLRPTFRSVMDLFTQVMGLLMIALTLYVVITGHPPYRSAIVETIFPRTVDLMAIITIVGGTVGGYISFAGAHRLLDAGIAGPEHMPAVRRSSVQAILVASLMRVILFLAALSVVSKGLPLDPLNPPASVFALGAGTAGRYLFGLVMWAAAITSVVGSAFTSISFLKTWHPGIARHESRWIIGFVYLSLAILLSVGRPVQLLIWAGTVNGFILPLALSLLLISVRRLRSEKGIRVAGWQLLLGWLTVTSMTWMVIRALTS